jgi:hypothetical protein
MKMRECRGFSSDQSIVSLATGLAAYKTPRKRTTHRLAAPKSQQVSAGSLALILGPSPGRSRLREDDRAACDGPGV